MIRRILVIAAHPDDEVLGCGATIARHAKAGDEVHVVILAEGVTSREKVRERGHCETKLSELAKAAHTANEILGVHSLSLNDLPDNRLDSVDLLDVVKLIEDYVRTIEPDILYTHHAGDVNIDHRRIHEAVITATRPQPGQTVKTLLFFEIQSSTEWQPPGSAPPFAPNWFVDITSTLALKMNALAAYKTEMRPWPHSRSCEAVEYLARWRGTTVGCEAAEAFVLGRQIVTEVNQ
ncbi:MAG: PIG-L deacetylase family protein [Desulfuromonadales bacterium]